MMDERERLGRVVGGFAPPDDAFERLINRKGRKQRNRRIRAGALGVLVALATGFVLARSLTSSGMPADRPTSTPAPVGVSGALAYALDGDIYVADPDGTNAVKVAARGIPNEGCAGTFAYSSPSWSPDGRYLAFERECSYRSNSDPTAAVIADPDGTVLAEIPTTGFSWSPDATRLAVWGESGRTVDVYEVDGVRQVSLPVPPVAGGATSFGPVWMPDGSALLVPGDARPSSLVVPLDGSPAYEVPGSDGLRIDSPDGTRVAVIGDRSTTITDADGAPVSKVDMPLRGLLWSPEGNRFASVNRRGELIVVDVASGKVTVLSEASAALSEGEYVNVVRGFSPQGDRILYAALVRDGGAFYNNLYSIGVDGSDARLLVVGAMQGEWRPR